VADIKSSMRVPLPKFEDPHPVDKKTFHSIAKVFQKRKKMRKSRSYRDPHFGKAPRFAKTEEEKWKRQVRKFNETNADGKVISLKNGPKPGPGRYNLVYKWKGKPIKKKKLKRAISAAPKRGERLFDFQSKGPSISFYYKSKY
jgi:hypothetical protein